MEKKYSQKQMENAVMLAAGLYQRLYNESGIKGSSLDVAMTIIHEACKMEEWIEEKYGPDDEDSLDREQEYEAMLAERYDLAEPKEPEPWLFSEEDFIEKYCPMAGGNDYLGWIDDICKLLDGEAEPGDAASTGDYADLSEDELRMELKRLTAIVLHQAVDEYVERNY